MNATTPKIIDDICAMLQDGVTEVFTTSFQTTAEPAPLNDTRGGNEMLVAGTVGFVGDVVGIVYIYVRAPFARTLASLMLQMPEAEMEGDEMVNDVIGEMTNMVVGAVKSRLCDTGFPCKLTIPSVVRGQNLHIEPTGTSECRLLSFVSGNETILVEFLMKPST